VKYVSDIDYYYYHHHHHHHHHLTNNPARCTILSKYIYLFLFSTCFGHPSAHYEEQITVSMRHWYLSLCMGGVWSSGWIETSFFVIILLSDLPHCSFINELRRPFSL